MNFIYILEGTVGGRKRKGKQKLEYAKQIIYQVGCSGYCEMERLAQDRITDEELHCCAADH